MNYNVGIDLGGTKIYGILIDDKNQIVTRDKQKVGSNKSVDNIIDLIESCYRNLTIGINEKDIKAVGVAVPSSVDFDRGVLLNAPNLGLVNVPIRDILSKRLNKIVYVDNDANLGTFSEFYSIKNNYKSVYGIFVGTGVGGGYINDGKIVRGKNWTAGEVGHMIVKIDGPKCNCGNEGCLEAIAGKVGIIKYLIKKIEKEGEKSIITSLAPNWRESLGSSAIKKAFLSNDKIIEKAIYRSAKAIGIAMANIVNLIGVDAFILGGGVIEELKEIYIPIIEEHFRTNTIANGSNGVPIIVSSLGDDAVAMGAALLSKNVV